MERIRRIVASYPDAPAGIEGYTWITVPKYWESVRAPTTGDREVYIVPRHEDQHAGIRFRVGWHEEERVAAVWLL